MREYRIYLTDILDAMEKIEIFMHDMPFETFCSDDKTVSAVRDKLIIIGEAAKNVPENIRAAHPDIAWKEMAGMRDILTHAYFRTDLKMLYRTATDRIPPQKTQDQGYCKSVPVIQESLPKNTRPSLITTLSPAHHPGLPQRTGEIRARG